MAKISERNTAKNHFLKGLSQKEIAKKVGVQEKTISNWVKKYGWKQERDARINSTSNQINQLKRLIGKLTDNRINLQKKMDAALEKDDLETYAILEKKANTISNEVLYYNKTILTLDKENKVSLAVYLGVMEMIFNAMNSFDSDLYMKSLDFQEEHLSEVSIKLG